MTESTCLASSARERVWRSFICTLPTALTLVPVAMLCGILAAQSGWSFMEVLFFSSLGFSGSGQLALLPLAGQGFGILTMLLMTVSINSRYIPIAFATASRLPSTRLLRAIVAHMLGDEAYAVETTQDATSSIVTIRLTIYAVWVLSNTAGALLILFIPHQRLNPEINLGFPASVVLLALSLGQLKVRVPQINAGWRRRAIEMAACVFVALGLLVLVGKVWFWLPSIAFSTWRMSRINHDPVPT